MISQNLAESDYEGWVAWVDNNTPILEHVEYNPKLLPLMTGAQMAEFRAKNHNVMEWKDLPHSRLLRVELYFAKEKFPQPIWRVDREPGLEMCFIQMKMGSVVVATDRITDRGQQRTGVVGYRMGFWVPSRKDCQMWEFTRNEIKYMGKVSNPMAPRPEGFGLAPHVVKRGLSGNGSNLG